MSNLDPTAAARQALSRNRRSGSYTVSKDIALALGFMGYGNDMDGLDLFLSLYHSGQIKIEINEQTDRFDPKKNAARITVKSMHS